MYPVLLTIFPWLDSHQYLAIWLEGIALLAIFIWDRWDSHQQHKQTLAQMTIMQNQARATVVSEKVLGICLRMPEENRRVLAPLSICLEAMVKPSRLENLL